MKLFKPDTVGDVVAERTYTLLEPSGDATCVKVLMGKPERPPDGQDYYCPFQILGIGTDKVSCGWGIDAFQAIQLAMNAIGFMLSSFGSSGERKLSWGGDSTGIGFPVS